MTAKYHDVLNWIWLAMKKRTELSEHIRVLRQDFFHENQSEFAARLGLTTVSVARYETVRVPKRPVLKALENLALDVGDKAGATAFRRAIGPRFEMTAEGHLKPIEVSAAESLLDDATRIYGNWSALQGEDMDEKDVQYLTANVDIGLRELMSKLRKLSIGGTNDGEER